MPYFSDSYLKLKGYCCARILEVLFVNIEIGLKAKGAKALTTDLNFDFFPVRCSLERVVG